MCFQDADKGFEQEVASLWVSVAEAAASGELELEICCNIGSNRAACSAESERLTAMWYSELKPALVT